MDTADLVEPEAGEDGRSAPELATLLVELGRIVKARCFYPPRDPKLGQVFGRGLRAWQVDLERHGPLEIELVRGSFRAVRSGAQVAGHQLGGLAEAFAARALRRVRFEPGLDAEALAGFVELLATEADDVARAGGFARLLYARVPAGIVVNGTPPSLDPGAAAPEEPADEEATPPLELPEPGPQDASGELVFADDGAAKPGADAEESPAAAGTAAEAFATAEPGLETARGADAGEEPALDFASAGAELRATEEAVRAEATASGSEGGHEDARGVLDFDVRDLGGPDEPSGSHEPSAAPALETDGAPERPPANEDELRFADEPAPGGGSGGTAPFELAETGAEGAAGDADLLPAGEPEAAPAQEAQRPGSAPERAGAGPTASLEAAPLDAEPRDARAAELVEALRAFDACEDASSYGDLARRITVLAERLSEEGAAEEAYRAILVLAAHASGERKHAAGLARIADEHLRSLAVGRRLEDLIARACAPRGSSSVRATQVLLQLGESVVPPLLDAAELERDPDRRGQMHGILIAMGEKTLPELLRVMDGDDPSYVRNAVRIAGETQNPDAVPKLEALLSHADAGIRDEAARALVRVGDRRAIDVLVKALVSHTPDVPALAAYCLGVSGSPRAVRPLLAALKEAANAGRVELAREMIRALGRLGAPEATPDLAEIVLQRGFLKRRRLRELKVAAASALGRLPGDDAVGALAQAAQSRDPQIRRAAQIALDRRARSLAGR